MIIRNRCSALTKRFIRPSLQSCKVFSLSKNGQQAVEEKVSQRYHVWRNSNKTCVVVTNSAEYFQHPYNFPENSGAEFLWNTRFSWIQYDRKFGWGENSKQAPSATKVGWGKTAKLAPLMTMLDGEKHSGHQRRQKCRTRIKFTTRNGKMPGDHRTQQ